MVTKTNRWAKLESLKPKGDGRKVILVVEDEMPVREFVSAVLEGEGYAVLTASNGEEAIEVVLDNPVDLVVSDILMPKMDGHVLSQTLRLHTDLPVVLMSAHQAWTLPTAAQATAHAFLKKPFGMDEILGTVRRLLTPPPPPRPITFG